MLAALDVHRCGCQAQKSSWDGDSSALASDAYVVLLGIALTWQDTLSSCGGVCNQWIRLDWCVPGIQ